MTERDIITDELKRVVLKNFFCTLEEAFEHKIYHYITFNNLIKSDENQEFYFERASDWKDPYENFLFNATIIINGSPMSFKDKTNWIYAKCFSIKEESYAMWKMRESDCIRFESTVGDFFNILFHSDFYSHIIDRKLTFRIGIVDYKTKEEIKVHYYDKLKDYNAFIHNIGNELLDSMFTKRAEYDFEKELRVAILYENKIGENIEKLIFKYDNNLLKKTRIIFHPELDEKTCLERKRQLTELGFCNVGISDILNNQYLKIKITDN